MASQLDPTIPRRDSHNSSLNVINSSRDAQTVAASPRFSRSKPLSRARPPSSLRKPRRADAACRPECVRNLTGHSTRQCVVAVRHAVPGCTPCRAQTRGHDGAACTPASYAYSTCPTRCLRCPASPVDSSPSRRVHSSGGAHIGSRRHPA
ncbi:hypothetical protein FIBSPDRAFT_312576 [Athelia psychrophila]|uniref:Uncharacterized protein n=1 Tax=Athelia psychrophila TaxID=1759441 RepID=A0A166WDV3_9AGAM|nr:hypothetical protein FIBSPDRAFT_312576 [Fibularhizoctonia sp. CBS 109695]